MRFSAVFDRPRAGGLLTETDPIVRYEWRTAATGLAIFLLSYLAFLAGIDTPDYPYFDETHYVPAARQLLQTHFAIPTLNLEHPPLAKELMALSIWLFGDNPFGWRAMSALFGALAMTGIYLCGRAVFDDRRIAVWATAIAALNQMLFVQARVGMLDIFALAFVLWGLAAFMASFRAQARTCALLAAAGLCFGLATACKWSGIFGWGMSLVIVAVVLVLRRWRTQFEDPRPTDWYRPDLWAEMRARDWLMCLGLIPLAGYVAAWLPIYGFSPSALWEAQRRIFHDNATLVAPHPYMSAWPSWPFLLRPVWFLFEKAGDDRYWAVLSLGNPVILWSAISAILVCLRDWIVQRRRDAFLISASYAALYLAWMVLPRAVGFSFYYLPSATVASLALAYCFHRSDATRWLWARWIFLAAALAGFLLLLPISAAYIGTSLAGYDRLMWFASWR
jgi:dolichyl-phosphate-mannose--protein O-mannosyl transferase